MTKRFLAFFLCFALALGLCACDGIGKEKIHSTMDIPQDGWVEASVFDQIKAENAIVTFVGESGGCRYEWTVFGEDIESPQRLNLGIDLEEASDGGGVAVSCRSEENFGFSPVLSVYLSAKWNTLSATVYTWDGTTKTAFCSASVTGSKDTIVNFAVTQQTETFLVTPDASDAQLSASETTPETIPVETGEEATEPEFTVPKETLDPYLSRPEGQGNRVYSDGKDVGQDKYLTDPIPEGKPRPVEPEDVTVGSKAYTCTFSIECSTILNNMGDLDPAKLDVLPSDGIILKTTTVTFYEGESVFDVLQRLCKEKGIHMSSRWTPIYNSAYVEGIHNLYEFDCGSLSGWMYRVNGWYPNYGCSRYQLAQGDVVEWRFTCDLGADVGCDWLQGG